MYGFKPVYSTYPKQAASEPDMRSLKLKILFIFI